METRFVKNILIAAFLTAILSISGCIRFYDKDTIAVYDQTSIFLGRLENPGSYKYRYIDAEEYKELKDNLEDSEYYALLSIPPNVLNSNIVHLISYENISREMKLQIASNIEDIIESEKLSDIQRSNDLPLTIKDKRTAQTRIRVIDIEKDKHFRISLRELVAYLVIVILLGYIFVKLRKKREQETS